jgi:hypothetical protein
MYLHCITIQSKMQQTFSSAYGISFNLKRATQLHNGQNIIHITSQQIKNT